MQKDANSSELRHSSKMAAHHKLQAANTLQGQRINRRPLGQRRDAAPNLNSLRGATAYVRYHFAWLVNERQYKSGRAEAEVGGTMYLEAGLSFRTCAAHVRLTQRAHCRPRGQWKRMWREKGGRRRTRERERERERDTRIPPQQCPNVLKI